jgi:hypothetical protein
MITALAIYLDTKKAKCKQKRGKMKDGEPKEELSKICILSFSVAFPEARNNLRENS